MLPGDIELSTQKRKEDCIFPRYVTDDGLRLNFLTIIIFTGSSLQFFEILEYSVLGNSFKFIVKR